MQARTQEKKRKEKKRKEKFTLFSDHNGSLLRRQPGEHVPKGGANDNAGCFVTYAWQLLKSLKGLRYHAVMDFHQHLHVAVRRPATE